MYLTMSNKKEFEITYIEDESGSISVVPGTEFIARNLEYGESLLGDNHEASSHAKDILKLASESGLTKTKSFTMRPYTYGEKLDAQRKATALTNGEMRVDVGLMNLHLLCSVTELDEKDLKNEPTPIINALFEEMQAKSEPDPQRMLFLLGKSMSGDSKAGLKDKKSRES